MLSKRTMGLCALAVMLVSGEVFGAPFTQITYKATDNSAQAVITCTPDGANTDIDIVLTNLLSESDIVDASNLLTGFKISPQHIEDFSLTSQSAVNNFVFSSDTMGSIGASTGPHWVLDNSKKALYFNGFGGGGVPIIGGPAKNGTTYENANSSLTAGQHMTNVYQTATFDLVATGTIAADDITGATFLFNTNGNKPVDGTIVVGSSLPEPATLSVLGLGVAGLGMRRRRC